MKLRRTILTFVTAAVVALSLATSSGTAEAWAGVSWDPRAVSTAPHPNPGVMILGISWER